MTGSASREIVDEIAVRMELCNACGEAGGVEAWSLEHGQTVPPLLVISVIHGRQSPTPGILAALGYERVTRYARTSCVRAQPPGANSPNAPGAFHSSR
jgi:hypothetical protein